MDQLTFKQFYASTREFLTLDYIQLLFMDSEQRKIILAIPKLVILNFYHSDFVSCHMMNTVIYSPRRYIDGSWVDAPAREIFCAHSLIYTSRPFQHLMSYGSLKYTCVSSNCVSGKSLHVFSYCKYCSRAYKLGAKCLCQ